MLRKVLFTAARKPVTGQYPQDKSGMAAGFRGKLKFEAATCAGCKMCMRDCPSGAISIRETAPRVFEAELDLSKCIFCAQCVDSCPRKSLEITGEFELAQLDKAKLKVILHGDATKTGPVL